MAAQINIDKSNMYVLAAQFLEMIQQRGKFSFAEAFELKSAVDTVLQANSDVPRASRDAMLQGLKLGQERGAFTLHDASNIYKLLEFVDRQETAKQADVTFTPPVEDDDAVSIGDEID